MLNLIWYQILGGHGTSPPQISYWIIFWAKLLLPALHQKWRIYQLIPQAKELLIKLAWLTKLGVKKIPKVQAVELTLSICLCDLQVFQSPSVHRYSSIQSPSLHSLQQYNGSFYGSSHSFQLPSVEGGHWDTTSLQRTLQSHNGDGGRAGSLCWKS